MIYVEYTSGMLQLFVPLSLFFTSQVNIKYNMYFYWRCKNVGKEKTLNYFRDTQQKFSKVGVYFPYSHPVVLLAATNW